MLDPMPTYEYKCTNGHHFEVTQRMVDDPIEACPECGAPVERVFHPVAVHFKGSGFYTTDYGAKKKSAGDGGESKPDSKDSKKSDSKKSESSSKTATSSE